MINKVILVGNVGADPEIRTLESGVKTARVRLATTERFFNRQTNESSEQTEWHTIILWRGLADVVDKYVRKPLEQLVPTEDRPLASSKEAIINRYNERFPRYTATCDVHLKTDGIAEHAVENIVEDFL